LIDIEIYSSGICKCSACVPKDMEHSEIERLVNLKNSTGISSKWRISSEPFGDDHSNPCVCNMNSDRLHYLLEC